MSRIFGAVCCLLFCTFLAACGGVHRDLIYKPVAPLEYDKDALLGQERGNGWGWDLDGAGVSIWPVTVSSKLSCLVGPCIVIPTFWEDYVPKKGPLDISVTVKAKPEASVVFDPRKFAVILEDGRPLSPKVAGYVESGAAMNPIGPIMLSDGQIWRGRLRYDVPLMDVRPFILRLGTLQVNGKSVHLPPIPFVQDKSAHSS